MASLERERQLANALYEAITKDEDFVSDSVSLGDTDLEIEIGGRFYLVRIQQAFEPAPESEKK